MGSSRFLIALFIVTSGIFFSASHIAVKVSGFNTEQIASADSLVVDDGPYIFYGDKGLIEKQIKGGKVVEKNLPQDAMPAKFKPSKSVFKKIEKIAALSDIHGQYDLMIDILKNNKIIDNDLKWSFGAGHLVIVGDVFDRGDRVTEILWFIYNLEKQALENDGMVHYLLGNHEYMVMQNDLRYVNKKYLTSAKLLGTTYKDMFNDQTVLGRWLRSKNTVLRIDDNLFVHGGISLEFVLAGFDPNAVNNIMRKAIDKPKEKTDPLVLEKYFGYYGPIWYRGYFEDNLPESRIDSILTASNVKHIVVGHTSQLEVKQLYHRKIFAVDSSIKLGKYGEILLIKDDNYTRGTATGDVLVFD